MFIVHALNFILISYTALTDDTISLCGKKSVLVHIYFIFSYWCMDLLCVLIGCLCNCDERSSLQATRVVHIETEGFRLEL